MGSKCLNYHTKKQTYFLPIILILLLTLTLSTSEQIQVQNVDAKSNPTSQNAEPKVQSVNNAEKSSILQPSYTENLAQFKDKNYNARSEKFLACWLYLRELPNLFRQNEWVYLVKKCMKNINRKQSVLKITELGKRNLQPITPFEKILSIQKQLPHAKKSTEELSQFDKFLLSRSKQFAQQLSQINKKGSIENQIQQQLKKRQKYYFGFIPASMINHTTVLIGLSVVMMCCCTWCRFYKASQQRKMQRKLRIKQKRGQSVEEQSPIKNEEKMNISRKKIPSKKR